MARPGDGRIATRHVAILVADGMEGEATMAIHKALTDAGAVPRLVGARLGSVETLEGDDLDPDATLETTPSVLYDAVVIPDGAESTDTLASLGHAVEFVKDQYRHCKAILALGTGRALLEKAMIPLEADDPALILAGPGKGAASMKAFMAAIAKHRNWDRAMDPPPV
jgi:catalase